MKDNINARFLVQIETAFYSSEMPYMVSPRGIIFFFFFFQEMNLKKLNMR